MADAGRLAPPPGDRPAPGAQPAIAVEGLTKRFGALTAVDHLTCRVNAGETVVLWGPNGAGKTTILRCLLGIIPFEGTVAIFGHDVRRAGVTARALIGYVPQELGLHSEQTVEETVRFYAQLRRIPTARTHALLDAWQLGGTRHQPVRTLSGGMKQKLALVVALLADPSLLLLDEPTSHLDLRTRQTFAALLEQLKREGKTVLFCSHRTSEIWKVADRVMILEQGRCVAEGSPEAMQARLNEQLLLGLRIASAEKRKAATLLAQHGFVVHPNGTHVWVEVSAGRKIEPLQLLASASIPVLDFEIEPLRHQDAAGEE